MLHYWFNQADEDTPETPVVLWLNGGPGSSSLIGLMQEMGPVIMNASGGLMRNPYSWTKQANLLAIESPAGVGYSYCAAMLQGGSCNNTDVTTAKAARAALQDFFGKKFPELRNRDFYITGESYAGVYVPTLSEELLRFAPEVQLRGLAVGDPCTDYESQKESMDMTWYAHKNGLLPDADFEILKNCSSMPTLLAEPVWKRLGGGWARSQVDDQDEKCIVAKRKFLLTTSRGIDQSWAKAYINELDFYNEANPFNFDVPGNTNYDQAQWMNREDVREALHVKAMGTWPGPSEGWQYHKLYDACHSAPDADSMVDVYRRIAPQLRRTIVFNGDTDPCVSYEGTRTAMEKLGFPTLTGGSYRPWFYNKSAASLDTLVEKPNLFGSNLATHDAGAQFGGDVVDYAHNLSFVTVHGAGHMVPQFRPQASERLLNRLLTAEPFSPLLPSDADLAKLSQADFSRVLDAWTDAAKAAIKAPRDSEIFV